MLRVQKVGRMSDIIQDYFSALRRLKEGRPTVIAKGSKITNDSVSLEAGRKKGTIKKSRPIFHDLIVAINAAASVDSSPHEKLKEQLSSEKGEAKRYRVLWEEALSREISLVKQLWNERADWASEKAALTGEKVASIRSRQLQVKIKNSHEE
jgi:hypothetical protein